MDAITKPKAAWTVEGFCEHYSLGRTKVFELMKPGGPLKRVRVGRRTLITDESAQAWWLSLQKAS